jgi:SAM-dependent methyltransferase
LNGPSLSDFGHPALEKAYTLNDGWAGDVVSSDELLPLAPGALNLYLSNMTLHSVNDLPGTLAQIRTSLAPDGLFMAALPGGETLRELRDVLLSAEIETRGGASPRVYPFIGRQEAGALLQRAGFALPVVDSETVTITYENFSGLLADIRGMGERNALSGRNRNYPGKAFFRRAADLYRRKYSERDGRLGASVEIIYLTGWAPHESQQKPLRPGSAGNRLSDALGAREERTSA